MPGQDIIIDSAGGVETPAEVRERMQVTREEMGGQNEELATARRGMEFEREFYRALFSFAPDGYLVTDARGTIREANQTAARMLNLPAEFLLGKPMARYVSPADRANLDRELKRAVEAHEDFAFECEILLKPHRAASFPVTLSLAVGVDPGASTVTIYWLLRDISARKRIEDTLRAQNQALIQTLHALVEEPELHSFLQRVLLAFVGLLNVDAGALWLVDADAGRPRPRLVYDGKRFLDLAAQPPEEFAEVLARQAEPLQKLMRTRRPVFAPEAYPLIMGQEALNGLLLFPLLLGDTVIGWFTLRAPADYRFHAEEIESAQALAQQAALAVQMDRLAEKKQEAAVLEERNRIGREIHDTLAQGLAGIAIHLDVAQDALTDEPEKARRHIQRAHTLAKESLMEARRSVWELRPGALQSGALCEGFTSLLKKMALDAAAEIMFHCEGTPYPLSPEAEHNLLRIGQEAVTNAVKHSEARTIQALLEYEPDEIRLRVLDDGRGFDPTKQTQGFGRTSMQERAERIEALLAIQRRPERGMEVLVRLKREVAG